MNYSYESITSIIHTCIFKLKKWYLIKTLLWAPHYLASLQPIVLLINIFKFWILIIDNRMSSLKKKTFTSIFSMYDNLPIVYDQIILLFD